MAQPAWAKQLREVLVKGAALTVGTVVGLVVLAALGSLIIFSSPQPVVQVPNVIGMSPEEADSQLRAAGLRAEKAGERYDDTIPAGAVCHTDPGPGRSVRRGRLVQLYTSKGPQTAVVPDLIGRKLEEARLALARQRLEVGEVWKRRSRYEAGTIVSQEPSPGTKVPPGSAVDLELSGGPEFGVIHVPGDGDKLFRAVVIRVPADSGYHHVVVEKIHEGAAETLHDQIHAPGETVQVDVVAEPGDRMRVYIDERRVLDRTL
ncbi:MAG: PASTA domain-containing protein [Armatimonadetes bacterium]|nr:PASTA domain-containing protein [Armatimonadota bacterium]